MVSGDTSRHTGDSSESGSKGVPADSRWDIIAVDARPATDERMPASTSAPTWPASRGVSVCGESTALSTAVSRSGGAHEHDVGWQHGFDEASRNVEHSHNHARNPATHTWRDATAGGVAVGVLQQRQRQEQVAASRAGDQRDHGHGIKRCATQLLYSCGAPQPLLQVPHQALEAAGLVRRDHVQRDVPEPDLGLALLSGSVTRWQGGGRRGVSVLVEDTSAAASNAPGPDAAWRSRHQTAPPASHRLRTVPLRRR